MTDDIVARLRNEEHWTVGLCDKAADEIERLRGLFVLDGEMNAAHVKDLTQTHEARISKYADEIERLRAHLKVAIWSDSEECKFLAAEIARKDAAIAGALDHLDPRPGTYSHTAVIILTAALAPAQEASDDAAP
jgi:hypothetical protein